MMPPVRRCTDCNATFQRGEMNHARGCPLIAQCNEASDADKEYFRRFPHKKQRQRPATPAERQMVTLSEGFRPVKVLVDRGPSGLIAHGYVNAQGMVGAMAVIA